MCNEENCTGTQKTSWNQAKNGGRSAYEPRSDTIFRCLLSLRELEKAQLANELCKRKEDVNATGMINVRRRGVYSEIRDGRLEGYLRILH